MFLITQPNGLFFQYLQINATNYTNSERTDKQSLAKTQKLSNS